MPPRALMYCSYVSAVVGDVLVSRTGGVERGHRHDPDRLAARCLGRPVGGVVGRLLGGVVGRFVLECRRRAAPSRRRRARPPAIPRRRRRRRRRRARRLPTAQPPFAAPGRRSRSRVVMDSLSPSRHGRTGRYAARPPCLVAGHLSTDTARPPSPLQPPERRTRHSGPAARWASAASHVALGPGSQLLPELALDDLAVVCWSAGTRRIGTPRGRLNRAMWSRQIWFSSSPDG